jgi:hypothetical protein
LDNTSLSYNLVFTTAQLKGRIKTNGVTIYMLIRCGSREAAIAQAYYAVGNNGWNLAFSCVTRCGEGFEERSGKTQRVKELWQLADEDEDEDADSVRVFY